jgi:pimeloyl-ACP methyl ester carboxylesterase
MTARASLLFVLISAAAQAASPCTAAKPECTEWIVFGGGPARSLIYRTHALDTRDAAVVRALIVIHGMNRDADNYFKDATAAAFLAGALEDTVVIAPRIASAAGGSCRDVLAPNEVSWPCNIWRSGGAAVSDAKVTSFDFTDEILRQLASKAAFPNLKAIVVTGHSAGGQYAERYAMSNTVHEKLGVPVTYVVSNPSSYAYLDALRPAADAAAFAPYADAANCPTYDRWPYGLQNRVGYTSQIGEGQLKRQMASRPVTYLLGELDTLPLAGFDSSCPAMAQGPSRLARGQSWAKYVNQQFGAHHQVVVVPMCGHNARCMYTSDAALPVLFPKP